VCRQYPASCLHSVFTAINSCVSILPQVMGNYYAYDGRSVFAALWEGCGYAHVSPDAPGSGILWYTQPQDKTQ
jgi:hypothetical protein